MEYYTYLKKFYQDKYWAVPPQSLYAPNGYPGAAPLAQKAALIARHITRPGKIIDLGCGNGLLLQRLMAACAHPLIPYGVDLLERSISQAKTTVLPAYKNNFSTGNANTYVFKSRFDHILLFPDSVSDKDFKSFFKRCLSALTRDGQILLYVERDSFARFKERTMTLSFLRSQKLSWSAGSVLLGIARAR